MNLSTNRFLAVIVLVCVVVIFTPIGVIRSVSALASDIEEGFYNGVYNDEEGYTEKSIQSHLDNRANAANGLLTLSSQLGITDSAYNDLQSARYALIDSVTISDRFSANELIAKHSEEVYDLISGMELTEDQQQMLDYYMQTLRGAQTAIEGLSYNDTVSEFYDKTLKTFPVSLFSPFLKTGPEYFS